ncbi:MAG: N-acetylmuramoyl-L-alanine amidase [Pseudomonadota bacterium]
MIRPGKLCCVFLLGALVLAAPAWVGADPWRVVLDPGHGGRDVGIVGPSGLTESWLTLELAGRLKAVLENEPGFNVQLARRDNEKNPSLAERTALANRVKADFFASLHAGSSLERGGAGFKVYYQDYGRQEGLSGKMILPDSGRPGLGEWILNQAGFLDLSRKAAVEIDLALGEVLRKKTSGPIGLPLAVLAGAAQPAVLIEVGALTDPADEARLASPEYREALVRGLARGIESWRRSLGSPLGY